MDEKKELLKIFNRLKITFWRRDDAVVYIENGQVVIKEITKADDNKIFIPVNEVPVGR
jgi:hypothetical protein